MDGIDATDLMKFIAALIAIVAGPVGVYVTVRVKLAEVQSRINQIELDFERDRHADRDCRDRNDRDRAEQFALLRSIEAKVEATNISFAKQPGECAQAFALKSDLQQLTRRVAK